MHAVAQGMWVRGGGVFNTALPLLAAFFSRWFRLQRLLAFYFQKKLENEEKAVVKSGLDEAAAPSVTAAAAPQSARSTGDQEQK